VSRFCLEVLEPGLLSTVQDLGRSGLLRYGVTTGGALDQAALILGNRLVGNEPDAAGLELTLVGPRLRFEKAVVLALTGADLGATLDGVPVPLWRPVLALAGSELAFPPGGARGGARAYLCLAGGITVAPVMGGRGTDLFGRFGGLDGRPLQTGDRIKLGNPSASAGELRRRRLAAPPPVFRPDEPLRVVLGPQADRFTEAAITTLCAEPYTVSAKADRMGLRLTGPPLELMQGADLISEGIHQGSIQVPGDEQPIALTRARQTIGGYPKIATIIGADLDALAHYRPGDPIRFAAVDPETARALTLAYRAQLGSAAVTIEPAVVTGWTSSSGTGQLSEEATAMETGWTPAAVARLVADLEAAEVSYLKLTIESAGLTFELRRGAAATDANHPGVSIDGDAATGRGHVGQSPVVTDDAKHGLGIVAPMLGVFYRRPAPEQPAYAEVGQVVTAGQPIGLIEVMKTYHEVTASREGTLAEYLVEDGQFVEYGQIIARLAPD
jgi:antagonist of KipI